MAGKEDDSLEGFKAEARSRKKKTKPDTRKGLSTGSTLLNLALTNRPNVGFLPGKYYFLVGDSNSGKTWLSLTCFAEAAMNSFFDEHRFIYDNAEDGALMDIERFFGKKVKDRLETPGSYNGQDCYSTTIEEFYYHLDDAVDQGTPFIYVLDSMDSLGSADSDKHFLKKKKGWEAERAGKTLRDQARGSYGDGKAKINSSGLRRILPFLRDTGSILIIVNQTRDNPTNPYDPKTRSGGHALTFYATCEIWSAPRGKIKKKIRDKERIQGVFSSVRTKKNRITGRDNRVTIPIYNSFGIDDVGSCIDYLLEEGAWKKVKGKIIARGLDFSGTREEIAVHVEENGRETELKMIVSELWSEIEQALSIQRKKRYE